MQNLIRNAIYFCKSYCLVDWKIKNNKDLYIEVIDDGKGISYDIENKIFEWRMTFDKVGGTGVGLNYVKFVADIHGGYISYFRRNELTVFALLLPDVFDTYSDDNILLNEKSTHLSKEVIKNIKNKVIFIIEDPLSFDKIKSICWPTDIQIVYHRGYEDTLDLSQCFCIYTDTSADIIEKALSLGISVVLHKRSYSKQFISKKILRLRKK